MAKVITLQEFQAHTTRDSLYTLVHEKVYDVTKFIDEHPGGDEVILAEAGRDATDAFEDVGHSDEARELLPGMLIGEMDKDGVSPLDPFSYCSYSSRPNLHPSQQFTTAVEKGSNMMYFLPLGLLGAYFAWRFYGA
ncbi:cytochrome b5-like heme/steroid binding domain-containing protein [Pisolithus marmoratus]|nr:cytochrome b5-like heme/steroid binding domain-containing protein [Pisolithus marmoratus]